MHQGTGAPAAGRKEPARQFSKMEPVAFSASGGWCEGRAGSEDRGKVLRRDLPHRQGRAAGSRRHLRVVCWVELARVGIFLSCQNLACQIRAYVRFQTPPDCTFSRKRRKDSSPLVRGCCGATAQTRRAGRVLPIPRRSLANQRSNPRGSGRVPSRANTQNLTAAKRKSGWLIE